MPGGNESRLEAVAGEFADAGYRGRQQRRAAGHGLKDDAGRGFLVTGAHGQIGGDVVAQKIRRLRVHHQIRDGQINQDFAEQIGLKKINLGADVLKVYLTNVAPAVTDTAFGTPAEITAGNGYTAGGTTIAPVWTESPAGTGSLTGTNVTWTAAGGSIGPFRYAVLYDDTATPTKHLIGWWDYASNVTLAVGESFTVAFTNPILTIS